MPQGRFNNHGVAYDSNNTITLTGADFDQIEAQSDIKSVDWIGATGILMVMGLLLPA